MSKFSILIGCWLLFCGAEWLSASPILPNLRSAPTSYEDELFSPRIRDSWLTNFAYSILANNTIERSHLFYNRLMRHEWRERSYFALKLAFCQPSRTNILYSLYRTNANRRKMAAFFADKYWRRLDRMVEADKIFQLAVRNSVDNLSFNNWYGKASEDERVAYIWEEIFKPLEAYLTFFAQFEQRFAKFQPHYDENSLRMLHNFEKRFIVNETVLSLNNADWSFSFYANESSEFLTGLPVFASHLEIEDARVTELIFQRLFLKSVPLTYAELKNKESEELEWATIAEAILQLGEIGAKTKKIAQELYDEAISETSQNYDGRVHPKNMRPVLFEKLQSKFESRLKDQFLQAKKNVKNQMLVMHNTIADLAATEA